MLGRVGETYTYAEAMGALGAATYTYEFATPWQLLAALSYRGKNGRRAGAAELGVAATGASWVGARFSRSRPR